MTELKCPHCQSSSVTKTTVGKVTTGAKEVGKIALTVGGKVIDESIGFSLVGKGMAMAGKWALSYTPVEFVCNSCDSIFNTVFDDEGSIREITIKKLPMPDRIIEQVRAEYIQKLQKMRPYISAVVFSLLTLYFNIFMFKGIADDNGFQIFICFFLAIPFLIPAILKFKKISKLNNEITECTTQTLMEFKRSHRDLFLEYRQYN